MGNCIRILAEGVSLIASDRTWIEGNAIQQLKTTATLEGMRRVVGMPDLHPGRGSPIGAAFFSVGRFHPVLVGNDIGCGMGLWQTDLSAAKASAEQMEKRLGSIDGPLDESWDEEMARLRADYALEGVSHQQALGTIGGGNHFAEVQRIDQVYDSASVAALGLDAQRLVLLVHSDSRGLGQAILWDHVARFKGQGLAGDSEEGSQYMQQHDQALRFAVVNRQMIAARLLDRLRAEKQRILDCPHNFVEAITLEGTAGWLHRKGATPTNTGPVLLPGSRGDYTYLVEPLAGDISLFSLAHGAGRKWMRGECKGRLAARFTPEQLTRTSLGGRVVCQDRQSLYDEAPQAYKPIETILADLCEAGVARPLARMRPILTYKASEGER